jgi:hypothetical protein
LIAIVSYAAFPAPEPDEPIRIMYQTNAGRVLFDHKTHTSAQGYGLACTDCHHPHPEGEEIEAVSCSICHPPVPQDVKSPEFCTDCHDVSEISDPEIMKRSDAYHEQCIGCHEQYGAGPQSGSENCGQCHVL